MPRPLTLRRTFARFWRLARHFRPELARQRRLVAGSFVALMAGVLMQLLEPWPLKWILDYLLLPAAAGAADSAPLPPWVTPEILLLGAAGSYVLIVAGRATAEYLQTLGFALIGNRVVSEVRGKLYRHMQSLPLSFHNKSRTGDLLIRVVGDVKMLRDAAVTTILPLAGSLLVLVGMVSVMLVLNWRLGLLALLVLPLFSLSSVRIGRRVHEAARKQRQREGAVAAMAAEAISSMHVVQALSLEQRFEAAFASEERLSVADEIKTRRLSAQLERTTDLLIAVATALVLGYGGHLAISGSITPGDLVVFLTYLKRGFRPLQDFAKYTTRLAKATAAGERVVELLEIVPEVCDAPHAIAAPPFAGRVRFEAVSFEYEPDRATLADFSAAIEPGALTAIVGPSGSGKSTLLSLLMRFHEPTGGRISIDGHDLRDITLASLRGQIGVVLQDTVLFAANVYDNIGYGAPSATIEQIEEAARIAGADEFIRALPEGYQSQLGERGVNLSQGQRQRIAIARTIVRNAPIVLLDEPTTALDQKSKRAVQDAMLRLVAGRTALWITHDLYEASQADTILVIESGQIIERGAHRELLAAGGRYAQLFRLQAGEHSLPLQTNPAVTV